MRLPALVASLLALIFVAGCASTVSPLYLKTDAVTDPAIVGTWVSSDKDNPGTVRIEKTQGGSYQVTVHASDSGDDAVYEARLVKLGGASFADLLLTKSRHAGQDFDLPWGAVALHEIVKYQVAGDDLSFSMVDPDDLKKSPLQFRGTKKGTVSEIEGDAVILSTTAELRRYLSAHPADIFATAGHFTRQH